MDSKLCAFEKFGDEILLNIFTFLTPQEVCESVARLSKRVHQVSQDVLLWRGFLAASLPDVAEKLKAAEKADPDKCVFSKELIVKLLKVKEWSFQIIEGDHCLSPRPVGVGKWTAFLKSPREEGGDVYPGVTLYRYGHHPISLPTDGGISGFAGVARRDGSWAVALSDTDSLTLFSACEEPAPIDTMPLEVWSGLLASVRPINSAEDQLAYVMGDGRALGLFDLEGQVSLKFGELREEGVTYEALEAKGEYVIADSVPSADNGPGRMAEWARSVFRCTNGQSPTLVWEQVVARASERITTIHELNGGILSTVGAFLPHDETEAIPESPDYLKVMELDRGVVKARITLGQLGWPFVRGSQVMGQTNNRNLQRTWNPDTDEIVEWYTTDVVPFVGFSDCFAVCHAQTRNLATAVRFRGMTIWEQERGWGQAIESRLQLAPLADIPNSVVGRIPGEGKVRVFHFGPVRSLEGQNNIVYMDPEEVEEHDG